MKAVLHLPVAEQYPSRMAMVSAFASKRTSGMSGGLLCFVSGRWVFRRNKFRPDQVPVIGTKVAPCNFAISRLLDRSAVFSRELSLSVAPKTHRLRSNAKDRRHLRRASAEVNCFVDIFHDREFYTRRIKNQQLHLLRVSTSVLVLTHQRPPPGGFFRRHKLFVENFNNKHLHPLTTWFLRL